MATLRKRGDSWQAQVRRKSSPPQSKTFKLKADAHTWARQIEAQIDRQELPPDKSKLRRIKLSELLERYRDTITVKKRGKEAESYRINKLLHHPISSLSVEKVTPLVLSAYRDGRLELVTGASVKKELALLRHMFNVARTEWAIPLTSNPVDQIKLPSASRQRERRLQAGELKLLLDGCKTSKNPFLPLLIQLAVETGMRRGELLAITVADIDLTNATLHIPTTKNGHARTIPLTRTAQDLLKSVVPNDHGRLFPLTANAFKSAWVRLLRRTDIDNLHFHDLRHEAISRFFEMGLSVPEVALISGHRDYRMLFRYTHLRAEDISKKLPDASLPRSYLQAPLRYYTVNDKIIQAIRQNTTKDNSQNSVVKPSVLPEYQATVHQVLSGRHGIPVTNQFNSLAHEGFLHGLSTESCATVIGEHYGFTKVSQ